MAISSRERGESSKTRERGESSNTKTDNPGIMNQPPIDTTSHDEDTQPRQTNQNIGNNEVFRVPGTAYISCYERPNGVVLSMAAGKNGLLYTSASDGTNIRSWNRGIPAHGFSAEHTPNYALLLLNTGGRNHMGGRIYVGSSDGRVRIWGIVPTTPPVFNRLQDLPELEDGMKKKIWKKKMKVMGWLKRWNWQKFPVTSMSFSEVSEGIPTYLYTGSTDCSIKVWRLRDWTLVDVLKKHKKPVCSVAAGCGSRMFSGSEDGSLHMWHRNRRRTGTETYDIYHTFTETLLSGTVSVNALFLKSTTTGFATEAGRSELYAGLADGKVLVWKERLNFYKTNMETLLGHNVAVTCLAGSPGHLVFSGSKDGKICAWSSKNGTKSHTLMMVLHAHEGQVNCIAAHEDWEKNKKGIWSCILYSGSEDKKVKTWRIRYRVDNVLPGR